MLTSVAKWLVTPLENVELFILVGVERQRHPQRGRLLHPNDAKLKMYESLLRRMKRVTACRHESGMMKYP